MANNTTLGTIRTIVRQRTHYESSQFVTDAELATWINASVRELYDLLVATFEGYYVTSTDFNVTSGNTIAVPSDFYKLQAVDYIVSSPDRFQTLRRVMFNERNSGRQGYDLRGNTIYILPYAWAAGRVFRVWYTPVLADLADPGGTLDAVQGWDEYVIADVCCKVFAKSGEPGIEAFVAAKAGQVERINAMAAGRDEQESAHTQDVHGGTYPGTLVGGRWIDDGWY